MSTIRTQALLETLSRKPINVELPSNRTSDYYGQNVFDRAKMQKYLSKEAYKAVMTAIEHGTRIERKMADQIALGMKAWAIDNSATHYTHWFHPLTESTAEKHDAFIDTTKTGVFENFDGKLLVQQEPDASSFPNGGIRATFEARGYTAWDPSSPAFIMNKTLVIPTIFISYTGESLDYKAPLLKALTLVDKAAVDVCQYFDKDVTKVNANLGWEQEYFLVDSALYNARPDLFLCGRTLMGHASAKDQQLEDQYFASTPERVSAFMREMEIEAYRLGIPCKTRHNEVAPNQYELAPIFEEANLAVDHNMLIMEIMRRTARKHNFEILLHEKPFAGVNGSGKHNNWSLSTNTGVILYAPGATPKLNLQFLTFVVNTLKAVHVHADLLRTSIVSAGNEHRLGANEAPPAIISAFLGTQVSKMLDEIETKVSDRKLTADEKTELKLDIGKIPQVLLDNTDRNRTSTFAFTGNRFEFRAVGSNANCANAMIILNTIVADQLIQFKKDVDALINKGTKKDEAILQVLRQLIIESKNIRFDGDGYSDEWKAEAKRRGLSNIPSCPEALKSLMTKESKKVLTENGIFNEREIDARYEVALENYIKKIQIESRVLGDLALNHIIPVAVRYQNILIENCQGLKALYSEKEFKEQAQHRLDLIAEISNHIISIKSKVADMAAVRYTANRKEHAPEKAAIYGGKVKDYLDDVRTHIDALEIIVDNEMWPVPKYRELLFIH